MLLRTPYQNSALAPHPRADLHHAILLRDRDLETGGIVHAHTIHNRIIRQGIEPPILASRSRRHVLVPLVPHLQGGIGPARGLVAGDQGVVAGPQGALDVGTGAVGAEAGLAERGGAGGRDVGDIKGVGAACGRAASGVVRDGVDGEGLAGGEDGRGEGEGEDGKEEDARGGFHVC
jgi:hypothetical protein